MKIIIIFSIIFAATYVSVYSSCSNGRITACEAQCNVTQINGSCLTVHGTDYMCFWFLVSCASNCAKACQAFDWTSGSCSGKTCSCTGTREGSHIYSDPSPQVCDDYDDGLCSSNCISHNWRTGWCVEKVCKCTDD